jgi:hypothetical protein
MAETTSNHRLGTLAVRKGWIREDDLDRMLRCQRVERTPAPHRRIGDLMLRNDLLSADQLRSLLKIQGYLRELRQASG